MRALKHQYDLQYGERILMLRVIQIRIYTCIIILLQVFLEVIWRGSLFLLLPQHKEFVQSRRVEQLVVGHPEHLGLARVVLVQQTRPRSLSTQFQQIVDLLNSLEGFLRGQVVAHRREASRKVATTTFFTSLQHPSSPSLPPFIPPSHTPTPTARPHLPEVDSDGRLQLLKPNVHQVLDGVRVVKPEGVGLRLVLLRLKQVVLQLRSKENIIIYVRQST